MQLTDCNKPSNLIPTCVFGYKAFWAWGVLVSRLSGSKYNCQAISWQLRVQPLRVCFAVPHQQTKSWGAFTNHSGNKIGCCEVNSIAYSAILSIHTTKLSTEHTQSFNLEHQKDSKINFIFFDNLNWKFLYLFSNNLSWLLLTPCLSELVHLQLHSSVFIKVLRATYRWIGPALLTRPWLYAL